MRSVCKDYLLSTKGQAYKDWQYVFISTADFDADNFDMIKVVNTEEACSDLASSAGTGFMDEVGLVRNGRMKTINSRGRSSTSHSM